MQGRLLRFANMFRSGFVRELAPDIARSIFISQWRKWDETLPKVQRYVQEDISMWGKIPEDTKERLHRLSRLVGQLDWLTPLWIIRTLSRPYSDDQAGEFRVRQAIASFLLGDEEAHQYLERQVEELKRVILGE